MDNVILSYGEIELYKSEIDVLCDEYINSLSDENMIYKPMIFNGLLLYLYNNKLKFILPDSNKNNYELYDDIFYSVYLPLCYKYDKTPTILQFSCLINKSNKYLSELKSGIYKDGSKVNPNTTRIIQKWYDVCEKDLASKAIETNGIGSIFTLKSRYKWRDNDSVQVLQIDTSNIPDASAIMEKYRDVKKPELIEFNDN